MSPLLEIKPISRSGRPGDDTGSDLLAAIRAADGVDLIMLPQLSFSRYFPDVPDREGLELGEREPFGSLGAASAETGKSHLFASVYECVGEGVFYVRGELRDPNGNCLGWDRQREIKAAPGAYEQMFISPGHGPRAVIEAPWGPTGLLLGADASDPRAYEELSSRGARIVLGGVSETAGTWDAAANIARAMARALGLSVCLVNRESRDEGPDFVGGAVGFSPSGEVVESSPQAAMNLPVEEEEVTPK